jgi:hypothetical protein
MLQAINSKRKSEGDDQTFKRLIAIYFIPDDRNYAYCKAQKSREISGDFIIEHLVLLALVWLR